jgi:hypothetical protein
MAATPKYKVYDRHGVYQASVKELEGGAVLMLLYGDGATIRLGHDRVLWREGAEEQRAGDSYDYCTYVAAGREEGR